MCNVLKNNATKDLFGIFCCKCNLFKNCSYSINKKATERKRFSLQVQYTNRKIVIDGIYHTITRWNVQRLIRKKTGHIIVVHSEIFGLTDSDVAQGMHVFLPKKN